MVLSVPVKLMLPLPLRLQTQLRRLPPNHPPSQLRNLQQLASLLPLQRRNPQLLTVLPLSLVCQLRNLLTTVPTSRWICPT
jgi:hypothetical protein